MTSTSLWWVLRKLIEVLWDHVDTFGRSVNAKFFLYSLCLCLFWFLAGLSSLVILGGSTLVICVISQGGSIRPATFVVSNSFSSVIAKYQKILWSIRFVTRWYHLQAATSHLMRDQDNRLQVSISYIHIWEYIGIQFQVHHRFDLSNTRLSQPAWVQRHFFSGQVRVYMGFQDRRTWFWIKKWSAFKKSCFWGGVSTESQRRGKTFGRVPIITRIHFGCI
jgi:hypothetical protein